MADLGTAKLVCPQEVLHRIICIASEGFDTVPHAGALVTLMAFVVSLIKNLIMIFLYLHY